MSIENGLIQQWIPVSERLPNVNETVLALCRDGWMFVGFYTQWDNWRIWTAMKSTKNITRTVTHWMPLPDAPNNN